MRLPFLRTPQHRDEPTIVAMTGARLGDKIHFWGSRPELLLPLAARAGLSGQTTIVSPGASDLAAVAGREGLLVDLNPAPPPDAAYDLAVVHATGDWKNALGSLLAATRTGGRVIAIAGDPPSGLLWRLRHADTATSTEAEVVDALRSAGWQRVRPIGEREGMRFVEGTRG
jgi:hypothetical protein